MTKENSGRQSDSHRQIFLEVKERNKVSNCVVNTCGIDDQVAGDAGMARVLRIDVATSEGLCFKDLQMVSRTARSGRVRIQSRILQINLLFRL